MLGTDFAKLVNTSFTCVNFVYLEVVLLYKLEKSYFSDFMREIHCYVFTVYIQTFVVNILHVIMHAELC